MLQITRHIFVDHNPYQVCEVINYTEWSLLPIIKHEATVRFNPKLNRTLTFNVYTLKVCNAEIIQIIEPGLAELWAKTRVGSEYT